MRLPGDMNDGEIAPLRNPLAGTLLAASAGSRREIEFDVHNDSPDVAAFHLEADGPVAAWTTGAGQTGAVVIAPSGSGTLRLRLSLPIGTAVGDYEFRIRAVTSAGLIMQDTPLTLRVEPPSPETEALAAEGAAVVGSRGSSVPPAAALVSSAASSAGNGKADASPNTAWSGSRAAPPVAAVTPVAAASMPDAVFTDEDEPDAEPLNFTTLTPQSAETDETNLPSEASVLDPKEGAALPVRPGETLLARFGFINTGMQEITYILDEDRSLPQGWATLVQDQVNLTRNGSGEVSLRLTPPVTAEPGEYPFVVMFGLQGGVLTSRTLILAVISTPAVQLKALKPRLTIGPWYHSARFALEVSSAGNADTAFRISVKSNEAEQKGTASQDAQERASDTRDAVQNQDVHETEQWQYLFDRELDNLRSPAPNRPPPPVTLHLRLRRRGWWWAGMRETHRVLVCAVPVTEPENGGRAGNSVELSVARWRVVPFPAVFLAPLLLLLLLLFMGKPGNIKVETADFFDKEVGEYYIVDPPGPTSDIALTWKASPFALLRLDGRKVDVALNGLPLFYRGSALFTTKATEEEGSRMGQYNFTLSNILVPGETSHVVVWGVNTSPETPLCVKAGINGKPERNWVGEYLWENARTNASHPDTPTDKDSQEIDADKNNHAVYEVDDPDKVYQDSYNAQKEAHEVSKKFKFPAVEDDTILLTVLPGDEIMLQLVNLAPKSNSLNFKIANGLATEDELKAKKKLTFAPIRFKYVLQDGAISWKKPGYPEANLRKFPIKVDARAPVGYEDDLVFITTSSDFPIVRIKIHVRSPAPPARTPAQPGTAPTPRRPGTIAPPTPASPRASAAPQGGTR